MHRILFPPQNLYKISRMIDQSNKNIFEEKNIDFRTKIKIMRLFVFLGNLDGQNNLFSKMFVIIE